MQSETQKGKGWFVNECDILYLRGTVDGVSIRQSTGKKATKLNIAWIKKNAPMLLIKASQQKQNARLNFNISIEELGNKAIELTSHKRDEAGNADYRQKLRDYIVPFFKGYKLEEIKAMHIELFQKELLKSKSSATVKRCRNLLNIIMTKAEASDIISKNPLKYADNVQVTHRKRVPYSELEMRTMIDKADGWFRVFLILAFSTGLRSGELMGLKWSDIDFEQGFILLERSLTKGKIKTDETRIGKTKSHRRTIEIIPDVLKILKTYYAKKPHPEWMFVSKYAEPFKDTTSIIKYHLQPLLAKYSIPYKELTTTRHTFISMMMNKGFDKNWIQEMVGHKIQSDVTTRHYFTYERDEKRLAGINNFMFGGDKQENV